MHTHTYTLMWTHTHPHTHQSNTCTIVLSYQQGVLQYNQILHRLKSLMPNGVIFLYNLSTSSSVTHKIIYISSMILNTTLF